MPEALRETKLLAARMQYLFAIATARACHLSMPSLTTFTWSQGNELCSCRIPDTEMRISLRRLLRASLTFCLIFAGCGGGAGVEGPQFGTGVLHPPPKPGASISQTRMCECTACAPKDCCDGPEDDALPATCRDSYDFSDPACGVSVRSCASRCAREVWRVKNGEECAAKRPASCCGRG
jgi:hypothetical protein